MIKQTLSDYGIDADALRAEYKAAGAPDKIVEKVIAKYAAKMAGGKRFTKKKVLAAMKWRIDRGVKAHIMRELYDKHEKSKGKSWLGRLFT